MLLLPLPHDEIAEEDEQDATEFPTESESDSMSF